MASKSKEANTTLSSITTVEYDKMTFFNPSYKGQQFKDTPPPETNLTEGGTFLLRCEVYNQEGDALWVKNDLTIFHKDKFVGPSGKTNHNILVDSPPIWGQNSLNLSKVRLEDAGEYECQILPKRDDGSNSLRARTKVNVRPQALLQSQDNNESGNMNDDHLTSESSQGITRNGVSQIQVRQTPSSFSKLPNVAPSSSPTFMLGHSTSASASYISASSVHPKAPSTLTNVLHLVVSWPYMLLFLLAGLLLLANMYLVYSLVKRHRLQKDGFEQHQDNSAESDSNGGSASGSAATNSSRIVASEPPSWPVTDTEHQQTQPDAGESPMEVRCFALTSANSGDFCQSLPPSAVAIGPVGYSHPHVSQIADWPATYLYSAPQYFSQFPVPRGDQSSCASQPINI